MEGHVLDEFLKTLDEMGEQQVRRVLARGAWNSQRTKAAEGWLEELGNTRQERQSRESLQIAKSANRAAWIAAIAAIIAVIMAAVTWLLPRSPAPSSREVSAASLPSSAEPVQTRRR